MIEAARACARRIEALSLAWEEAMVREVERRLREGPPAARLVRGGSAVIFGLPTRGPDRYETIDDPSMWYGAPLDLADHLLPRPQEAGGRRWTGEILVSRDDLEAAS